MLKLVLCPFSDDAPGSEKTPEHEARHLIKKIRRQMRLLNREWAKLNQGTNEWQAMLDEVSEVYIYCNTFII